MSFQPQQQQQFSGSYLQSPPGQYTPQYVTMGSAQPLPPQPPPQWASSIMEDIKSIKSTVSKIESVEKTVNSISVKLGEMESKVNSMDKRIIEVEKACSFISENYDAHDKELQHVKGEVKRVKDSCSSLNENIGQMEKEVERINDKILDQEFRSMRENLIFYNIPETQQSTQSDSEKCDLLVKELIENKLQINASNILLDRAHRLGNKIIPNKPRPIIVKFHYYKDREQVRTAAQHMKEDLKKANLGVGIQLPKEWRDARKQLYPVMQSEKSKGNNVRFIGEKLFINGQLYKPTA